MNYCFLGFCRYLACKTKHIASLNFIKMSSSWFCGTCKLLGKQWGALCLWNRSVACVRKLFLKWWLWNILFFTTCKCNPNETICMKIKKLNISMTQFHSAIAIIMAPKHESFTTPPTLPPLYKHPPVPLYVCLRGLYLS